MNKKTLERLALAEKIVELRRLGYTTPQIITELKTSYSTVYNAFKSAGLKPIKKNQYEKMNRIKKIAELKEQGFSAPQIGERLNLHPVTVNRLVKTSDTASPDGPALKPQQIEKIKRVEKIIELKKEGFSGAKIAKMLNLHKGTVNRLIRESDFTHKDAIKQKKEKIIELKNQGFNKKEVAEILNFSYSTVARNWVG